MVTARPTVNPKSPAQGPFQGQERLAHCVRLAFATHRLDEPQATAPFQRPPTRA